MNKVLKSVINNGVTVYRDEFPIYTKTLDEQMEITPVLEVPKDVPRSELKFTVVRKAFAGFTE